MGGLRSEMGGLRTDMDALRLETRERMAGIETALGYKADKADVAYIEGILVGKADKGDVAAMAAVVDRKADTNDTIRTTFLVNTAFLLVLGFAAMVLRTFDVVWARRTVSPPPAPR